MPSKIQKSYYAIRALNVEIASIKDGYNIRSKRQSTISFGGGNEGEENDILSSPASLALQMRIEWWKNAINKIYTTAPLNSNDDAKHTNIQKQEQEDNVGKDTDYLTIATSCWTSPVVRCLHRSLYDDNDNTKDFKWTKRFMERLIDAREIDLNVIQYNTLDELVNYSSETVSSVLYLTLESAGVRYYL